MYFLVFNKVKSNRICNILLVYSVIFFLLNLFFKTIILSIPRELRQYYYFAYTLLEYACFASIFFLIVRNKSVKTLILVCSCFFVLFQIYYVATFKTRVIDSVPIGISTILVFVYVVAYMMQEFRSAQNEVLYEKYTFWISVGIMIYLGLTFFFNILAYHIKLSGITKYWDITFAFDIIKNGLFGLAIYLATRQKQKSAVAKTASIPFLDMI